MKKTIVVLCFAMTCQWLTAQPWTEKLPENKVLDGNLSFYEIQKAFNEYWEPRQVNNKGRYIDNGQEQKAYGWKQFKRWEYYWDQRVNRETGEFPTTTPWHELQQWKKQYGHIKNLGNWQSLGSSTSTGGYAGLGRINCIAFHPTDNNTFWVGSPSGGIWKTTNGGSSWVVLNDTNDVLGVSDIAIPHDYAISQTLYIATGDRDGGSVWTLGGSSNDNNSIGVLKSTNGGLTWQTTGLTFADGDSRRTRRLIIHPSNTNVLYAGTSNGLFKSTDAGANWTQQLTGNIHDIEFNAIHPDTLYCVQRTGSGNPVIYKTLNGGTNWTSAYTISGSRVDLAVSAANNAVVYAISCNSSGGLDGIYKSIDYAVSFSKVFNGATSGNNLLNHSTDGSGSGGQGTYDLAIAASPADANLVFIGGINCWRSTNGGTSWTLNNHWYGGGGAPEVHADKHCLAFQNGTTLFEGNDGGIYKTTNNGTSWTDLTNGMSINQIYRLGVSQSNAGGTIIGLQDNGTKLRWNGTWNDVYGGDGMECIIDHTNHNTQYCTYVNGEIHKTTNLWSTETTISNNISGGANGFWVTPYIMHPSNNQTLFVGYADVWKTTNGGSSFTKITTMATSQKLRSMAISANNPDYIYIADPDQIWKTTNGGSTWQSVSVSTLPVSTQSITYLAINEFDPNVVYVTFGGFTSQRIYRTTNGGSSWQNISSGLPNVPTLCVVHNKFNGVTSEIYVGTEVGVFMKSGDNNWVRYSDGLPNVVVTELEIYYDNNNPENSRLRAATFGRGLWESPLQTVNVVVSNPTNFVATTQSYQQINSNWNLNSNNDNVMLCYNKDNSFGTPQAGIAYSAGNLLDDDTILYIGNAIQFEHLGLLASTKYYYKIWSVSDSNTYSAGIGANATTLCASYPIPYSENFTTSAFPACWMQKNEGGITNRWTISNSSNAGGTSYELKATKVANTNALSRLLLPPLNTADYDTLMLCFKHFVHASSTGTSVTLKLQISSDGNTWTDAGWSITPGSTNIGPEEICVKIADNITQEYTHIAFVITGDMNKFNYWYVDNISLQEYNTIKDSYAFTGIKIYPNPADEQLWIALPKTNKSYEIKLIDNKGVIHFQKHWPAQQGENFTIPLKTLASGIYNLQIKMDKQLYIEKIIKN